MLHLNIDEIIDIKEYKDYFEIEYSNGEIRYYNDKLSIICKPQTNNEDIPDHLSFKLRRNTLITLSTKNIYIFKNLIKIEFNSGLSKKEIEIKKIENVMETENYLFLKNKTGIKVLYFE
jgi:hypothetical protein